MLEDSKLFSFLDTISNIEGEDIEFIYYGWLDVNADELSELMSMYELNPYMTYLNDEEHILRNKHEKMYNDAKQYMRSLN